MRGSEGTALTLAALAGLLACSERGTTALPGTVGGRDDGGAAYGDAGGGEVSIDASADPENRRPFDVDSVVKALALADCARRVRCDMLWAPDTFDSCADQERRRYLTPNDYDNPGFAAIGVLVDQGRARFDAAALRPCLDALETGECVQYRTEACERVFVGALPVGAVCSLDAECAPGSFCNAKPGSCGVCTAQLGPGEGCERDAFCAQGTCFATCEPSGPCFAHCTPVNRVGVGEPCTPTPSAIKASAQIRLCSGFDTCSLQDWRCHASNFEGDACPDGECWYPLSCGHGEVCLRMRWVEFGESCLNGFCRNGTCDEKLLCGPLPPAGSLCHHGYFCDAGAYCDREAVPPLCRKRETISGSCAPGQCEHGLNCREVGGKATCAPPVPLAECPGAQ